MKMSQDSTAVLGTLADCAFSRGLVSSLAIPGLSSWDIFSRPFGTVPGCHPYPGLTSRTNVLGYSQPSLRDSVRKWSSHARAFKSSIYLWSVHAGLKPRSPRLKSGAGTTGLRNLRGETQVSKARPGPPTQGAEGTALFRQSYFAVISLSVRSSSGRT